MRLRMKVFADASTGKKYVVSIALLDPKTETVRAYLMSDEETRFVALSIDDYNAIPYSFFDEDGPAPPASARFPEPLQSTF